jgi:ubiquinone/menaquinone biosynthesis C-methylase UbiE
LNATARSRPLELKLPPPGVLVPNNAVGPLPFYYLPFVGKLFRARLNMGLRLLDGRFARLLEIGYGSGLLMPTLASACDELYGLDLEPEPTGLRERLARLGVAPAALVQANARATPFADGFFDAVVAFSIFEHLRAHELELTLAECARVLREGGRLLVGCPAVHRLMNAAFATIGFSTIEHHHFSDIADVVDAAAPWFSVERRAALPAMMNAMPLGWAPYTTVLFVRR